MSNPKRVLGEIREQGEAAGRCAAVRIARFVDAGDWGEYVRGYLGGLMSDVGDWMDLPERNTDEGDLGASAYRVPAEGVG